ncbi:MAG TPA: acyl-CoA dehydrogenase family protein, partial [Thermoleophilaceae bacterium]
MDFRDSPEDAAYRATVRAWLKAAVEALPGPEPATIAERLGYWRPFQKQLNAAGYAGLSWPQRYGGQQASLVQQAIFLEEYDRSGAPDRINVLGEGLAGPTIIDFGSETQRERFLRPILEGDHIWC